ncbi:MAG: hypothetical protein IKG42_03605 [Clostridia bacterium]|nr:hypothetical protein [Clostridia bacterium]
MDKVKEICDKVVAFCKGNVKVVGAIAAVVVVAIVALLVFGGGPKKAVKGFVAGMNKADSKKILKYYDAKGAIAWEKCDGDAEKFKDEYKDVDDDDAERAEEYIEKMADSLGDYDKYSAKVEKIKEVKKQKGCSGLYKVKAKVKTKYEYDGDEKESSDTVTFVVYKGKVISFDD